jgi:nicotinamidase-related amidase
MPRRAEPDHVGHRHSREALLVIDVLQAFSGEEGAALREQLEPSVARIARLLRQARRRKIAVIYVNDVAGTWRSNPEESFARAARTARGGAIARRLRPHRDDLIVLKPARSGFYQTPLEVLLQTLGAKRLVVTGVATDVCVLATVSDALVRKFDCVVPADCCATIDPGRQSAALVVLDEGLRVDTRPLGDRVWP